MKIIRNKIKLEITPAERKTFDEMVAFTTRFFEANNQCVESSCVKCPLNIFCGGGNKLTETTQDAIEQLEDFLNS